MNAKILWAKDHKELMDILQECMQKHYHQMTTNVLDWLNMQSLRVDVWKN